MRPPKEGAEPSQRSPGRVAGRHHLLHSWSYLVVAVIDDNRTNPWWLASPTRDYGDSPRIPQLRGHSCSTADQGANCGYRSPPENWYWGDVDFKNRCLPIKIMSMMGRRTGY